MAFAAGALVFPGGRIDADDHLTAELLGTEAAKVAAIRETIEETGLAPALLLPPDPATAAALRQGIVEEEPFASLLAAHGLTIDGDALTPFARWCPNFPETRRFDTLFFLAEAPAGAPEPTVSEHEAVRAFWASAAEILAEIDAGRAHAIFPTRRNLERLARFNSITEARADAARHPARKITP
jgi:8-oxo-dGTP pyrophosphatase MutT (NUDIX family)